MNDNQSSPPNNQKVITMIVITVCVATTIGVGTEAFSYVNKVPDMNNNLSHAFIHIVDTLIGALIAMLIQTRPQERVPAEPKSVTPLEPIQTEIRQPPDKPIPITAVEPKPEGT